MMKHGDIFKLSTITVWNKNNNKQEYEMINRWNLTAEQIMENLQIGSLKDIPPDG